MLLRFFRVFGEYFCLNKRVHNLFSHFENVIDCDMLVILPREMTRESYPLYYFEKIYPFYFFTSIVQCFESKCVEFDK